jgi:hypothetical protein
MMHEISWGEAKNNNVINVTLGKTKTHQDPWLFKIV